MTLTTAKRAWLIYGELLLTGIPFLILTVLIYITLIKANPINDLITVSTKFVPVGLLVHKHGYMRASVVEKLGTRIVLGTEDNSVFKLFQDGVLEEL